MRPRVDPLTVLLAVGTNCCREIPAILHSDETGYVLECRTHGVVVTQENARRAVRRGR